MFVETEIRVLVHLPLADVQAHLVSRGAHLDHCAVIHDAWYVPRTITTYDEHERWLAMGDTAPVRVRTTPQSSTSVAVDAKRPLVPGVYLHNVEASLRAPTFAEANEFLRLMGYHPIFECSKTRETYIKEQLEISLDSYESQDVIAEFELQRPVGESPTEAAEDLRAALRDLELPELEELTDSAALVLIRRHLKNLQTPHPAL